MQYTVDKEEEQEAGGRELEVRSLFDGFGEADNNFSALVSDNIRKHVRDIVFPAQPLI